MNWNHGRIVFFLIDGAFVSDSRWNRELNGLNMCLMQQIVSQASSHAVSEGFSRNFAFLLVVNRLFWELTDNCSSPNRTRFRFVARWWRLLLKARFRASMSEEARAKQSAEMILTIFFENVSNKTVFRNATLFKKQFINTFSYSFYHTCFLLFFRHSGA